jgi:hypothetical protein
VRVLSGLGPALVGLEARKHELYRDVSPHGLVKAGKGYVCRDFMDPVQYQISLVNADPAGKKRTSDKSLRLYPLSNTDDLTWYQVQGVFVETALFL